jgi:hypothetical protein
LRQGPHKANVANYSYATFGNLLKHGGKKKRLPKPELVDAFIFGAGGDQSDRTYWVQARAHVAIQIEQDQKEQPG